MQNAIFIIQIALSVLLIVAVLLQVKGKGGFGRAWGGLGGGSFTRRGLEGIVFKSTFILVFLFLLISIIDLLS